VLLFVLSVPQKIQESEKLKRIDDKKSIKQAEDKVQIIRNLMKIFIFS
jgi:hypothetical protein